jgi:hypothetical protein
MTKQKEVITFKFYTEQQARDFYARRVQIFKTDEADLNMYEVEGFGFVVEVTA